MEIRLHHVSVPTADLERSRRFYREILGLEEIPRPPFRVPGAWFRIGADQEVHLILGGGDATFRRAKGIDLGDVHFALRVADFGEVLAFLRAQGYREDAEARDPMALRTSTDAGYPQLYIMDPDRNVIEMNGESGG